MSGSKRWPVTAWRELLDQALKVLDEAGPDIEWVLGGGSALALRLNHRMSYDVDLFLVDARSLRALSPNRNSAARSITDQWQEPGNYIKLQCDGGAIDFVLGSSLTELPPWCFGFRGRDVPVEEPAEILAKKLKYRGSRLLPRDIFDLLAAHRFAPDSLSHALEVTPEGARRAADRIQRMAERYRETIADEINPTATGVELLEVDPLEAAKLLKG